MIKELYEAIDNLWANLAYTSYTENDSIKDRNLLIRAVERLESIDNAKPSEALEALKTIKIKCHPNSNPSPLVDEALEVVEQSLLKAQENEKENAYIEKIKTMMKQKDCVLRYIESEDCFAVKTILSDSWYKLTPEFVENNIREEIKPLSLIEKNKQLKEENAEYEKVLKVIFKKNVNMSNLAAAISNNSLRLYNGSVPFEYLRLTKEEFELLTKYWNELLWRYRNE